MNDLQYLQIREKTKPIPRDEYDSDINKALNICLNSKNVNNSKVKFINPKLQIFRNSNS